MKCRHCDNDLIELGDRLYCIPCGIGIRYIKTEELIPQQKQTLKSLGFPSHHSTSYGIGADKCNGIERVYLGGSCIPK